MKTIIPRRYLAIVAVITAIVMTVLDGTIMNVALPSLARQFRVSPDDSIWIVNSYQMVIMMTLLVFATIGDRVGYRRVFVAGVALFLVSSVLCALSTSFEMLVCVRALQGLGASAVMSVDVALVRLIYPPEILGRGMSFNAMAVAVSAAAGPSIGGAIITSLSWEWIFLANIPFALMALLVGRRLLPDNPQLSEHPVDKWSCLGNVLTFGLLIYAVESFAHHGSGLAIALMLLCCAVTGVLYVRRQLRMPLPLLPVDLLRIPLFSLSIAASICAFMAQMMLLIAFPFFLQDNLGFSPIEAGVLVTPWPLGMMLMAPLAGRLVERYHPGTLGAIGMLIFASGLISCYFLPADASTADIWWRVGLGGIGFGLFQTPNNLTIMSSSPMRRSGAASGMLGMARLVGQTVGATLVAIVFSFMPHTEGSRHCFLIALFIALAASAMSASRLTQTFVNPRNRR